MAEPRLIDRLLKRIMSALMREKHHGNELVLTHSTTYVFFSRLGLGYLLCAALIFVLGVNYQNNLILLVAYLMVVIIVLSMLQAYSNLKGLKIEYMQCKDVFAPEGARLILRLSHPKKAYAVSIHGGEYPAFLNDIQGNTVCEIQLARQQRGKYAIPRIKLMSHFPFALTSVWSYFVIPDHFFVYPAPLKTREITTALTSAQSQEPGSRPQRGSEEFEGLSEYQNGMNIRHVSWKHYAKSQQMLVKRYENYVTQDTVFDYRSLSGSVEQRLSKLSFMIQEAGLSGSAFALSLPGHDITTDSGPEHGKKCLRLLAEYHKGEK